MENDIIKKLNEEYTNTLFEYDKIYREKKEIETSIEEDYTDLEKLNSKYVDISKIVNGKDILLVTITLLLGVGLMTIKFPAYMMASAIGTGFVTSGVSVIYFVKICVEYIAAKSKNRNLLKEVNNIKLNIEDKSDILDQKKDEINLLKSAIHSLKLEIDEKEEKNRKEEDLVIEENISEKKDRHYVRRLIKKKD